MAIVLEKSLIALKVIFKNVIKTHSLNALGKADLVAERIARAQGGRLEQQLGSLLGHRVLGVVLHPAQQLLDHRMAGIDLKGLLHRGVELLRWVLGLGVRL
jgi:hypothetical protein